MTRITHPPARAVAPGPRRRRTIPAASVLLLAAACGQVDRLLTAETPSRLTESSYLVPQNAAVIVGSAVADFECALGAYVVAGGLASGELVDASQTAARWSYDRRDVLPADALYATGTCEGLGVYTPVNAARFTADQAVRLLSEWTDAQVPNRQRLLATAAAYAGHATLLLAEGFCAGTIDVGPELQTNALLDSAEARFTRALAAAPAGNQDLRSLALVGRARARIARGNRAGAAEDAAQVPPGFVWNANADAGVPRRQNRVFAQNNGALLVSIAPAYRVLAAGPGADPRVRATDQGRNAGDQVTRLWTQGKYASVGAPIPVATGVEAQLILAEARGGADGVTILNALRARPGVALPALSAAEAANFTATLFEERRRELFLQGNRWFDLRRANLPLVPTTGTAYAKGGSYGDQRCWPLPDVERLANPNLGG
jgi:hypothetical protein